MAALIPGHYVEQGIPVLGEEKAALIFFKKTIYCDYLLHCTVYLLHRHVDVTIYYISIHCHNKLQQFLYQRILESPDQTGLVFLM